MQAKCDRCGAVAKQTAIKGSLMLYFCNHHMNKNQATLEEKGFFVGEIVNHHHLVH